MKELNFKEVIEVSGGIYQNILGWAVGGYAWDSAKNYSSWVRGGAGNWEVEYNPGGYSDPLL